MDLARPAPSPRHSERSATAYLAFLGILIAFGIDVALPAFGDIEADLETGGSPVSLIITFYFVGTALGQLVYGPVADRYGRRNSLLVGLSLYVVGALLSAAAPSFGFLLGARFVWGLGAASLGSLRMAIARDLFEGDQMARVVTLSMAVFMIGPIFIPIIGELILALGPWPGVFAAGLVMGLVAAGWTWWFGETLPEDRRRPLELGPLVEAGRAVFTTRQTIGYILAPTFSGGAFLSFLGSSQPVIDQIFDRGDQFVLFFSGGGLLMVVGLLINQRLIDRYSARTMVTVTGILFVVASAIGTAASVVGGDNPSIWVWFAWIAVANTMATLITPMCSALALEPMGAQAGTAASILGVITMAGGAVLGALIDARIDRTVLPMAAGYLIYGLIMLVLLRWAAGSAPIPTSAEGAQVCEPTNAAGPGKQR